MRRRQHETILQPSEKKKEKKNTQCNRGTQSHTCSKSIYDLSFAYFLFSYLLLSLTEGFGPRSLLHLFSCFGIVSLFSRPFRFLPLILLLLPFLSPTPCLMLDLLEFTLRVIPTYTYTYEHVGKHDLIDG